METYDFGVFGKLYDDNAKAALKAYNETAGEMSKLDNVLTLVQKYWDKNKKTPVALSEVFGVFRTAEGKKLFEKPSQVGKYMRAAVNDGKCNPLMKNESGKIRVWSQKLLVNKFAEAALDINGKSVKPYVKVGKEVVKVDTCRVLTAYKLVDIVTFIAQNESLEAKVRNGIKPSFLTEKDFFCGCKTAEDVTAKCEVLASALAVADANKMAAPVPTAAPAPTAVPVRA